MWRRRTAFFAPEGRLKSPTMVTPSVVWNFTVSIVFWVKERLPVFFKTADWLSSALQPAINSKTGSNIIVIMRDLTVIYYHIDLWRLIYKFGVMNGLSIAVNARVAARVWFRFFL